MTGKSDGEERQGSIDEGGRGSIGVEQRYDHEKEYDKTEC